MTTLKEKEHPSPKKGDLWQHKGWSFQAKESGELLLAIQSCLGRTRRSGILEKRLWPGAAAEEERGPSKHVCMYYQEREGGWGYHLRKTSYLDPLLHFTPRQRGSRSVITWLENQTLFLLHCRPSIERLTRQVQGITQSQNSRQPSKTRPVAQF